MLAAQALVAGGICERICWVVPRDSLRLQAEEVFADPAWRQALGHDLSVRAADNAPGDPCRGLAGYVTTYQGIAAAPDLHLAAFRRHRYLLVVDEVHHLPGLNEADAAGGRDNAQDAAAAWSAPIEPLLALSAVRLLLSGTLERADGRRILWLPYRRGTGGRQEVDLAAPGWAVVGYSRARALAEHAVLPVSFGALDGEAAWLGPEPEGAASGRGSGRTGCAPRHRRNRPGRRCSPRCAPASPRACCGGLSRSRASSGPSAVWPWAPRQGRPRAASASCWWWRPTRSRPGATSRSCAAGCRLPRPAAWRWRFPTSVAPRRPWRPSG
ncbi:hypothetical protein ACFQY5_36900 [Paeniroseomonas aquatica]|uniref:hypothetical protein n=1 Tax=Paeniroseomonas aquatica TaxID=373043 RepID=UPI00361F68FF